MADMPLLRIPRQHVAPLLELANLPEDAFEGLVAVLAAEPPVIDRQELLRKLDNDRPELGLKASELLDALLSLDLLRASRGWSSEQAAIAVGQASGLPEEIDRSVLQQRLARCLGVPSLSATAKAIDVITSNERLLIGSRIYTEIRPIFADDPREQVLAVALLHTLELSYTTPSGRNDTFYVALDDEDVAQLSLVVERAQAKAENLRAWLQGADMKVVDLGEEAE
jgi:hypothetical protein